MSRVKGFAAFWYDFFVGDDWRLAFGVVLGIAGVGLLVRAGHDSSWWLLPAGVVITLIVSLRHAVRDRG